MGFSETIKSAQKPTNTALLKPSFWIVACLIIIHLDTISYTFNIEIKSLEISNLANLSVSMLLSIVALKAYRFISAILVWPLMLFIEKKELFNHVDKDIESKKISLSNMLYYSTQNNDGTIYKHYTVLKEETEKEQKTYEFLAYMFTIISINILIKGSVYRFLMQLDSKGTQTIDILMIIILFIISFICTYKSYTLQKSFYHPSLKEKIDDWRFKRYKKQVVQTQ